MLSSRALQKPRACSQCLDAFTACHERIDVAAAAGGRAWSGGKQYTGRVEAACPVHAGRAAGSDAAVQAAGRQRAAKMMKMANVLRTLPPIAPIGCVGLGWLLLGPDSASSGQGAAAASTHIKCPPFARVSVV